MAVAVRTGTTIRLQRPKAVRGLLLPRPHLQGLQAHYQQASGPCGWPGLRVGDRSLLARPSLGHAAEQHEAELSRSHAAHWVVTHKRKVLNNYNFVLFLRRRFSKNRRNFGILFEAILKPRAASPASHWLPGSPGVPQGPRYIIFELLSRTSDKM